MDKKLIISDFEIMKIPAKENGERLVSLREYSKEICIDIDSVSKKYEGLKDEECFVRESIAIMLSKAQSNLHNGIKIKIFDGYRSMKTQKRIYKIVFNEIKSKNHSLSNKELSLETDTWVANPKTIPPHTTGGAVDVTLLDKNGNEIDMGGKTNSVGEESLTFCQKISEEAKNNRKILIDIMENAGFVNYPGEWWHWCYGDRMWAYYSGKPYAIFDGVK